MNRLKARREKAGLTQEEMAQELGVSIKTYARWESDCPPKQWGRLLVLAEMLDCHPELLVPESLETLKAPTKSSRTRTPRAMKAVAPP